MHFLSHVDAQETFAIVLEDHHTRLANPIVITRVNMMVQAGPQSIDLDLALLGEVGELGDHRGEVLDIGGGVGSELLLENLYTVHWLKLKILRTDVFLKLKTGGCIFYVSSKNFQFASSYTCSLNNSERMERFVRMSLGLSGFTFKVDVKPVAGAVAKMCFVNCAKVTSKKFEKVVCWIVYDKDQIESQMSSVGSFRKLPKNTFEAELHCVLKRKRDGKFFDITPNHPSLIDSPTRTIAVEPRVGPEVVTDYILAHGPVENIGSPAFDKLFPPDKSMTNFFQLLKALRK